MSTSVIVDKLPKCDFCDYPAEYDAVVPMVGSWANMCLIHFGQFGPDRLGTGYGQQLVARK
jgi:hypothetical protein